MSCNYLPLSLCTTAMGRLDHVQQTLLRNIADNSSYPMVEFVLLDYGSMDGLGDWIRSNAMRLIEAGRLVYLRLDGVKYYSHAHSKNIAFLASSGDVLCNVDADNLLPSGFAFHLNELMNHHPRAIANYGNAPNNTKGRLAMFRSDFVRVGGYDEEFVGWGYDDKDLRARLLADGCMIEWFDIEYAQVILHDNSRRTENMGPDRQDRFATSSHNQRISQNNLTKNKITANSGRVWGAARLHRNFFDEITTGMINGQPTPTLSD